eukprot:TRINITY_DN4069_c1_g1_i1.p1 TRINITY_DN4069_c1_g1~~TRINITY_DN4069_c1_g1_i1.p1  ORF type:complete len:897 (+),score=219.72 TRINITY_DN4069_c1_g1_i1:67-2757(+)
MPVASPRGSPVYSRAPAGSAPEERAPLERIRSLRIERGLAPGPRPQLGGAASGVSLQRVSCVSGISAETVDTAEGEWAQAWQLPPNRTSSVQTGSMQTSSVLDRLEGTRRDTHATAASVLRRFSLRFARTTRFAPAPGQARNPHLLILAFIAGALSAAGSQFLLADHVDEPLGVWSISHLVTGTIFVAVIAYALASRSLPIRLLEFGCFNGMVLLVSMDWGRAAAGTMRVWPFFVLVTDLLLAGGGSRLAQHVILHIAGLWLLLTFVEDEARLGLYDMIHTKHAHERYCNCAHPPCGGEWRSGAFNLALGLLFVYLDFIATRSFAEGEQLEKERIEVSVGVAELVAGSLARFDLDEATAVLQGPRAATMPEGLRASLWCLLDNLAGYRRFLPASVFVHAENSNDAASVSDCLTIDTNADDDFCGSVYPLPYPPKQDTGSSSRNATRASSHLTAGSHRISTATGCTLESMSTLGGSMAREMPPIAQAGGQAVPTPPLGRHSRPSSGSRGPEISMMPPAARLQGMGSPFARRASRQPGAPRFGASPSATSLIHAPQVKRVSLVATNRKGFLAAASRTLHAGDLLSWMSAEVEYFQSVITELRGMTDLFCADHFYGSFGAAGVLGNHCEAAVRCAATFRDRAPARQVQVRSRTSELCGLGTTSAVCTGKAICGDFGSRTAQRYMVMGGVAAFVAVCERLAAAWQCSILVDAVVHQDVNMRWDCRLRYSATFEKRGSPDRIGLWELVNEKRPIGQGGDDPKEWMYEIASLAQNAWHRYNEAVDAWCHGSLGAAQQAAAAGLAADPPSEVREALLALQEYFQDDGRAAPVGVVDAVGTPVAHAASPVARVQLELVDLGLPQGGARKRASASSPLQRESPRPRAAGDSPNPPQQPPAVTWSS